MQVKQNQVPECFGLKAWHGPTSSTPLPLAFHQLKERAQSSFTGCAKNSLAACELLHDAQEKPHFEGGYNQDETQTLATV